MGQTFGLGLVRRLDLNSTQRIASGFLSGSLMQVLIMVLLRPETVSGKRPFATSLGQLRMQSPRKTSASRSRIAYKDSAMMY